MTTKKRGKISHPVVDAVLAGHPMGVKAAIEAGGDINERDRDGRTPLHHACIQNDYSLAELLINHKADVSSGDLEGWTPLHFAARNYQPDIARLLLRAGAVVDAVDAHGNTALFRAVFESRGRGEMIKLLIGAGADQNRKNKHGTSPADLARTIANFDVKQWLV